MLKRVLLPFLFSTAAIACQPPSRIVPYREKILIRHPQADVNYYCQIGQSLDDCVAVACSYATQYDCRIIGQIDNTYYIETYVPPYYQPPVVIVQPSPPPIIFPIIPIFTFENDRNQHDVRHRPRSNQRPRHRR